MSEVLYYSDVISWGVTTVRPFLICLILTPRVGLHQSAMSAEINRPINQSANQPIFNRNSILMGGAIVEGRGTRTKNLRKRLRKNKQTYEQKAETCLIHHSRPLTTHVHWLAAANRSLNEQTSRLQPSRTLERWSTANNDTQLIQKNFWLAFITRGWLIDYR